MILKEGARRTLAFAGCGLWLASSLMPLVGSFAMAVWSPPPWQRQRRWRLAPRWGTAAYHPNFPIACMIGAAWCLWRAALYPLEAQTLPFMAFWLVFAGWFAGAAWACRQDAKVPEHA